MKPSLQIAVLVAAAGAAAGYEYLCSTSLGAISCSGKDVTQPPAGLWSTVESLTLSDTKVDTLYRNSFSGFPSLRVLRMQGTLLKELDMRVFGGNQRLSELNLRNNRIERVLPVTGSTRIDNLRYVFLNNNSISSMDPDAFKVAANSLYVFLNHNPIVVAEGQPILNGDSLQLLHMQYGSSLGKLGPASFAGLPNLEELVLISANITSTAGAFLTNERLRTIVLTHNNITEVVAGTFPANATIRNLYLDDNPLERLEVAAVNQAMAQGGTIYFQNTPLACSCGYEALYWWAQLRDVRIDATCNGGNTCSFTRRLEHQAGGGEDSGRL